MANGVVNKNDGKAGELVDLSSYRERKLRDVQATEAQRKEQAERIPRELSKKRRELRSQSRQTSGLSNQRRHLSWKGRLLLSFATAVAIAVLLFAAASTSAPEQLNLFVACAALIPLACEKERLCSFAVYLLSGGIAWQFLPSKRIALCYICFGAYPLVRDALTRRISGARGRAASVAALALMAAIFAGLSTHFAWTNWSDNYVYGMPVAIYAVIFTALIVAALFCVDCVLAWAWTAYEERLRPNLRGEA